MGIAFGLGAALLWGLADYSAARASRRIGAPRVVLGFHVVAVVLMIVPVLATGALADAGWSDLPVFALLGAVGWVSYLAFYGALAIGPISIVSPIVSGYAAVTVVLAVLVAGESLSAPQAGAVVVVMCGVALASSDVRRIRIREVGRSGRGLLLAILAMVALGGFVFGLADTSDELGWLAPIFLARTATMLLLLATALPGGRWRFEDRSPRLLAVIVALAVLDTGGYALFNIGVREAATSVVATASAPYSVVPIVMGVLLLSERPARTKWAGIALVLAGLVILGLAS